LFLKNGAGGVHDQLWQKFLWKETEEFSVKAITTKNVKLHEGKPQLSPSGYFLSFILKFFLFHVKFIQHESSRALTIGARSARILEVVCNGRLVVVSLSVGLWRSWERASMAWKRSSVRSRPGPPNLSTV
jgi:hypothetical protein